MGSEMCIRDRLWDVRRVYVEEGGREDSALWDSDVYDACFGSGAVVGGVCLSASEVVGDEFDDGWRGCLCCAVSG